jgi:hypothetical protein
MPAIQNPDIPFNRGGHPARNPLQVRRATSAVKHETPTGIQGQFIWWLLVGAFIALIMAGLTGLIIGRNGLRATVESVYVVKRGDNLTSIANRFGTTTETLFQRNHVVIGNDRNLIHPGQRLRVGSWVAKQ